MVQMGLDSNRLGTTNPSFRAVDYRVENNKMRQALEPEESLKVRR